MAAGWPNRCTGTMRAGARRDRGLDGGRVEVVGLVLDVREDRASRPIAAIDSAVA